MSERLVAPPLPAGRRAVLYAVRRQGEATADQIAGRLGITVSGARQHLAALLDAGLVDSEAVPRPAGQRGRPQQAYSVTSAAESLFPKAYGELTNELLGYLAESGADLVDGIFERRRDQRIANARLRLDTQPSLEAKVAELTRILDEDGYLAGWEPMEGGYRVAEHNCAVLAVAARFGQACSSEIAFIQTVLPDTDVRRVTHMVSGDRCCAYEIRAA